jgi:hypothetical protein
VAIRPATGDTRKKVIDIGNNATPAMTALSRRIAWKYRGNTNSNPYMPKVISAAFRTAAENAPLRKIDSGSSGPGDHCSTAKKAANPTTLLAKQLRMGSECQKVARADRASGPSDLAKRSRYKKDLHDGSDFD